MNWPTAATTARAGVLAIGLLLGCWPGRALADSRELYAYASLVPAITSLREPGGGSSTLFSGGLELAVLYGLDNELHVGGALLVGGLRNATFGPLSTTSADGSMLSGTLYEDLLQLGLFATAVFRFDTSPRWAPVVRVDLGVTLSTLANRVVVVSGAAGPGSLSADLATVHVWAPSGRIALLAQRRIGDSWVVEAGFALRAELGPRGALHAELPLTAGWIF